VSSSRRQKKILELKKPESAWRRKIYHKVSDETLEKYGGVTEMNNPTQKKPFQKKDGIGKLFLLA